MAIAFAALFQGERITADLIAGGVLVLAGVYVGAAEGSEILAMAV